MSDAGGPTHDPEKCVSVRDMLQRLGDKWTTVVLGVLGTRRLRFGQLQREIDGISQRMLVVTLRNLERDGLVSRQVYPSVPPRVEYELTARGLSLRGALRSFGDWAVEHREEIEAARRDFDSSEELAK